MIIDILGAGTRAAARLSVALCALCGAGDGAAQGKINIYSYREPPLVEPLLKAFTEATKIEVNVVYAPNGLVERMAAEGRNSPADLLLTNEFAILTQARDAGVTQTVTSEKLNTALPATVRDPEGHWFALTRRARVIYASKARVSDTAITYEQLADPKWKGKICMRSGQHTYNVALTAAMIAHLGSVNAEAWLRGVKANLARKPSGGDREAVRDVHSGLCDLAIGNTYYMGAMLKHPEQKTWADSVKVLFPDANGRGTHVNISGMALAANAPNRTNAIQLMEFLVSAPAQKLYAETNHEYPAAIGITESDLVKSWGALKPDALPLPEIAKLRRQASEMIDRVRFDQGPGGS